MFMTKNKIQSTFSFNLMPEVNFELLEFTFFFLITKKKQLPHWALNCNINRGPSFSQASVHTWSTQLPKQRAGQLRLQRTRTHKDAHTGTQRESVTWFSKQPDLIIMQTDKCLVLFLKKRGALTTWLCIEVINMHTFTNWHINLPSFQSVPSPLWSNNDNNRRERPPVYNQTSVIFPSSPPPVSGPSPNQFVSPSLPKEAETARHCCRFHTCHATQLR